MCALDFNIGQYKHYIMYMVHIVYIHINYWKLIHIQETVGALKVSNTFKGFSQFVRKWNTF